MPFTWHSVFIPLSYQYPSRAALACCTLAECAFMSSPTDDSAAEDRIDLVSAIRVAIISQIQKTKVALPMIYP